MIIFDEDREEKKVDDLKKHEEEASAQIQAGKLGLPYLDLSVTPINIDALRFVPELEAREAMVAPFNSVDQNLDLAILSPAHTETQKVIERLTTAGTHVRLFLVSHQSLNKVWDRYKDLSFSFETKSGALDVSNEQITDFLASVHSLADVTGLVKETLEMKKGLRTSRILEIILAGGIATSASDIHIEPEENYVRLRYRLDGVLMDILDFDT